ncbi:putative polysaccharide export protein [Candidatus Protochlamydia naegleriophila]|uniref:Putative polysaccharide export protein n=2 Tax=Candidatus Protochlamydia naegleriophila TaxID=389348 RepID=A0A0U5J8S5_9BACT|nr:putative polysaccharide export protein [Candidatus Protochlamydia naegleriophila]
MSPKSRKILNDNTLLHMCPYLKGSFVYALFNGLVMKFFATALLCLLLFSSCSRPCHHYDIFGADEFVIDSYKIRQGKLAILDMEGVEVGELACDAMDEYQDVIAEDDILNIAVYHPKRRDVMDSIQFINETIGFRVSEGKVDLPDIEPIEVAGLTLEEARQKIQLCYREQIQDIEVFLNYKDRLSRKVELTGAVATPVIAVDGKIRLYEILALAKVPNNANFFKSYVVRDGEQLPIDLYKLMNQGDMTQNIVMYGGDRIFIAAPSDATVMVMGEVGHPRAVNLPYGFMSLREALVSAGGIPFTGNRDCIQVIRGNLQNPKIYVLSWDHIIHLPNDSLLLMPGDTVYVSEKPITQWNRFIDQLLPSCLGAQAAYGTYRMFRD